MRKNKRTAKKEPTAHASAIAVMEFLNSAAPDFLTSIVMETIERACEHLDPHPFYPTYEPGQEDHDKILLTALAKRSKLMSLRDLEESKASLARHIAAIYKHPLTPTRLYNAIGDFIVEGSNMKISACELNSDSLVDTRSDITLAEEWTWQPQTIERIIELTNKYDSAEVSQ
jgi:hypothetical protein